MARAILADVVKSAAQQLVLDLVLLSHVELDLFFDETAAGNAGRHEALARGASADALRALRRDELALSHAVNFSVRALERRHHERAAVERRGGADRGNRDVELRAHPAESRQRRGHHDGRRVPALGLADLLLHSESLHDQREGVVRQGKALIAGIGKTDHQSVAGKLVVAGSADLREILDARPVGRARRESRGLKSNAS